MLQVVSGALFNRPLFTPNTSYPEPLKVLMGRRTAAAKRGGLWELPGGKVERGNYYPPETHEQALAREWSEELGLAVHVGDFIATSMFDLEIPFTITLYLVHRAGQLPPRANVHDELQWVDLQHAVEYMPCSPAFYVHYPYLRDYVARQAESPM